MSAKDTKRGTVKKAAVRGRRSSAHTKRDWHLRPNRSPPRAPRGTSGIESLMPSSGANSCTPLCGGLVARRRTEPRPRNRRRRDPMPTLAAAEAAARPRPPGTGYRNAAKATSKERRKKRGRGGEEEVRTAERADADSDVASN